MSICNFAANWALIYSHLQSVTGEATGEATGKLNLEKTIIRILVCHMFNNKWQYFQNMFNRTIYSLSSC